MKGRSLSYLVVPVEAARTQISERISLAYSLTAGITTDEILNVKARDFRRWHAFNREMLARMFSRPNYSVSYAMEPFAYGSTGDRLPEHRRRHIERVNECVDHLQVILDTIHLMEQPKGPQVTQSEKSEKSEKSQGGGLTQIFHGSVGNVQVGDGNSASTVVTLDGPDAAKILAALRSAIVNDVSDEQIVEVRELLDVVEVEIKKESPKKSVLKPLLNAIAPYVQGASGNLLADLVKHLVGQ